jgi:3',5'-cyclic-AMP phosphodiesterase
VVSGDLCFHAGEEEVYRWIRPQLDTLGIPYEVMAGNHDDSKVLAEVFERRHEYGENGLYFCRNWQGQAVIFLDSAQYQVFQPQLDWLRNTLAGLQGDLMLFIHHPPMLVGMPFMDQQHPLRERDELQEILSTYPGQIAAFCGHYHIERTVRWKNLLLHVTPSCFFQIDSYSPEFKVDHYQIALREIHLQDGRLSSQVRYFPGSMLG